MDTDNRHLFLLSELIIYLSFLVGDLFACDTSLIKYCGIVLCFLRAFRQRNRTICLAFAFTLCADFILLLLNRSYLAGVCFFIAVQGFYLLFLYRHDCRPFLLPRALLLALLYFLMFLMDQASVLNAVVVFYFSLLLGNLFSSLSGRFLRTMSLGFLLFACCDICVGLHNLLPPGRLYDVITYAMWLFYLPSQVLICLGSEKVLLYKNG